MFWAIYDVKRTSTLRVTFQRGRIEGVNLQAFTDADYATSKRRLIDGRYQGGLRCLRGAVYRGSHGRKSV